MKMLSIKKPAVGFYLAAAALIVFITAFCFSIATFNIFASETDKWVIAMNVLGIWLLVCILANSFFMGEKFTLISLFYGAAMMCAIIALFKLLIPCLSPIGVYFTVNMGDRETQAKIVSKCLPGVALYVVSIVLLIVSSFMKISKGGEENV